MFAILDDVNIVGGTSGIHLTFTREGRPTGEGYIELSNEQDVENALKKHNEHLGPRYIEGLYVSDLLFFYSNDVSVSVQANEFYDSTPFGEF